MFDKIQMILMMKTSISNNRISQLNYRRTTLNIVYVRIFTLTFALTILRKIRRKEIQRNVPIKYYL